MQKRISPLNFTFNKELFVKPDKSISHRAVMLGALGKGKTVAYNPLLSDDVLSTADCMRRLGCKIEIKDGFLTAEGGNDFLSGELYAGNSGTTMRLLSGILASYAGGHFTLKGDESLQKRPMNRVVSPLTQMGASIKSNDGRAPLLIEGRSLNGIQYKMPVDSAQVKSAILFAGLNASGATTVIEQVKSRDHSENMLRMMGADIVCEGLKTTVKKSLLHSIELKVPGDISSAAFPLVLAACQKGAFVKVKEVSVNPTRDGILQVFKQCGVGYEVTNKGGELEPYADLGIFGGGKLKPFVIDKDIVPSLIDEIPVLAVMACFINGTSVIKGAKELRVKESDRISLVVNAINALGGDATALDDGMIINGKGHLRGGAVIKTDGDHRIAMSMAIAAALSEEGAVIEDSECVSVSYPNFYEDLSL